jgi:hypothetical protein
LTKVLLAILISTESLCLNQAVLCACVSKRSFSFLGDAQMTHRNFQEFRVLGFTLRMKAQVDSSSRGWSHAEVGGMQGDLETGGQVGNWVFISFLCIAQGQRCLSGADRHSWEGEVTPWPIIIFWDLL